MALLDVDIFMKDYVNTDDTSNEEMFCRILDRAQSLIEGYLNRKLEIQEYYLEKHCGDGYTRYFYTNNAPVIVVSELRIGNVEYVLENDGFYLTCSTGKIQFPFVIPKGQQNICISYYAGYKGDTVTPDLEESCEECPKLIEDIMYQTALYLYKKSDSGEGILAVKSISGELMTTHYLTSIFTPEELTALKKFKKNVV